MALGSAVYMLFKEPSSIGDLCYAGNGCANSEQDGAEAVSVTVIGGCRLVRVPERGTDGNLWKEHQ